MIRPNDRNLLAPPDEEAGFAAIPEQVGGLTLAGRGLAFARAVARRWPIIAGATGLCVAIALIYLLFAKTIYTSTARLYVEPASSKRADSNLGGLAPTGAISQTFLNTQSELIKSSPVLALAMSKADTDKTSLLGSVKNPLSYLNKNLNVEVGRNNDLISVSLDAHDPEEAAKIVNAVVDSYVSYTSQQRHSTADEMLAVMQKAKEERDTDLVKKQSAFLEFRKANGIVASPIAGVSSGNSLADRISAITQIQTAAELDTLNAKASYDEVVSSINLAPEKLKEIETAQDGGASTASFAGEDQLRARMAQLQQQILDLRRTYLPEHPRCKAAQRQLDEVTVAYVAASRRRWLMAQRKQQDLARTVALLQSQAVESDSKSAEYARLEGELTQAQKTVEVLDNRIKDIDVTDTGGGTNITVVETAASEDLPHKPAVAATLGFALLVGLGLGVVGAFARQLMDQQMHSVDEIETALDAPVLGIIPERARDAGSTGLGLHTHIHPASPVSEAYRTARMTVKHRLAPSGGKTLLICSPLEGDGRSTVVSNLAIAMAQAGEKVVIVDADLFEPSQHRIFSLGNANGLSRVLGEAFPFADVIRQTKIDGVDILPAGPAPQSASELLNGQEFSDLLGDLAGKYDYVLVDSPPLATGATARIIAAACDGTLLVVNAERSNRKLSRHSLDGMLNVGANVIGVVVNALRTPEEATFAGTSPAEARRRRHEHRSTKSLLDESDADTDANIDVENSTESA